MRAITGVKKFRVTKFRTNECCNQSTQDSIQEE